MGEGPVGGVITAPERPPRRPMQTGTVTPGIRETDLEEVVADS
ncbi:hypothetical protein [Streptomyces sp. NPDC086766]